MFSARCSRHSQDRPEDSALPQASLLPPVLVSRSVLGRSPAAAGNRFPPELERSPRREAAVVARCRTASALSASLLTSEMFSFVDRTVANNKGKG